MASQPWHCLSWQSTWALQKTSCSGEYAQNSRFCNLSLHRPSSIQALTCGCTLLLSGAVADALGARFMYIVGSVLQSCFTLACGLSRNALDIILFRAFSGIAVSFCLPSAVSIITSSFEGRRRDLAFAAMGGGQPVGFAVGLVMGGILTDSIGWAWAYYITAIFNTIALALAIWALPTEIDRPSTDNALSVTWHDRFQRLADEIDWVGAIILSTSLAMLSYVLATITGSQSNIRQPANIVLLVVAVALIPAFVFWVGRQEKLSKPAIIPNSLWRNQIFTCITLAVFLTWGSFNAIETVLSFFFQRVQLLNATQASIRFLPAAAAGIIANIIVGLLVQRVPGNVLVLVGCAVSCGAPLAMIFATPSSSYWSSGRSVCLEISNADAQQRSWPISSILLELTRSSPSRTLSSPQSSRQRLRRSLEASSTQLHR